MAGKGDKIRKDFDYKKYWTNFPTLSGEEFSKNAAKVIKKNNKTTIVYK